MLHADDRRMLRAAGCKCSSDCSQQRKTGITTSTETCCKTPVGKQTDAEDGGTGLSPCIPTGGCPGVTSLRPPWLLPKLTGHDVAVKPEGTALAPERRV